MAQRLDPIQKITNIARHQWLTPSNPNNPSEYRRQRSGGSQVEASLGKQFPRPSLEKSHHKNRAVASGSRCRP
jgi:hypothetical protein